MNDSLKEWKLVQAMVGLVAASALGFYVVSGNFQAQEWVPFLPTPKPPDTLIFHADAMRQYFRAQRFRDALREADWVLAKQKDNAEAIRTRAGCLLRLGQFDEAEAVFRQLVARDKKDIAARLALAMALRGKGDNDGARGILLRLLRDPAANLLQLEAARASLNAMDFKEPLFADQPTPPPPLPKATPTPEPLAPLKLDPAGRALLSVPGETPTPAPLGLREREPVVKPTPTPEPEVAPRVLGKEAPKDKNAPLELPPPPEKKEDKQDSG